MKMDASSTPDSMDEWISNLRSCTREFTRLISCTDNFPFIDRHLVTLWNDRKKIVARLRKNKDNIHIQNELAAHNQVIQTYADDLARRNLRETCECINGRLHLARIWKILKGLLGHSRPQHTLTKIQLTLQLGDEELRKVLCDTFYPRTTVQDLPHYTAHSNSGMDSDFTAAELSLVLSYMNKNTAPRADGITYAMLRNLSDDQQIILLEFFNKIWRSGNLPAQLKIATICVIPKPGKRPDTLSNLRPISLISYVGKVLEKMALNRHEWHLEQQALLPPTLLGFRRHVSTQDAALLIKQDIFLRGSRT